MLNSENNVSLAPLFRALFSIRRRGCITTTLGIMSRQAGGMCRQTRSASPEGSTFIAMPIRIRLVSSIPRDYRRMAFRGRFRPIGHLSHQDRHHNQYLGRLEVVWVISEEIMVTCAMPTQSAATNISIAKQIVRRLVEGILEKDWLATFLMRGNGWMKMLKAIPRVLLPQIKSPTGTGNLVV